MKASAKKVRAGAQSVKTVKAFLTWAEKCKGQSLLYRGLANFRWEVKSSAYRRLKESRGIPDTYEAFGSYISQLLNTARLRGFRTHEGRKLSDLELLAQLQHYGAATCLIDFTHNPLVALWFACREQPKKQGKVVVIGTGADATSESTLPDGEIRPVETKQLKKEVQVLLDGKTLWTWEPTPRENRIIAQQSIFVFGQAMIQNSYFKAVHIPAPAKKSILRALHEKFGINQKSLFGDFAGFALANAPDKPYMDFSADDYYEFAKSSFHSGENKGLEKAIQYCDKALEKKSHYPKARHLRGICNYRLQNWQVSIDDLSQVIAIDATNTRALLLRGQAYEKGHEPKKAMKDYTKVIKLTSRSRSRVHLRMRLVARSYRDRARASLKNP